MVPSEGEVATARSDDEDGGELVPWVFDRLFASYGPQGWWPAQTRLEVVVGAVLTQATAWRNVELALANLKRAGALDLPTLLTIAEPELAALVRPAGFFRVKARRLRALFDHVAREHNGDLEAFLAQEPPRLRRTLLAIPGIGPETADSIVLYAAGHAVFVIDAYTRRVWDRLGARPVGDGYAEWQSWFHERLPARAALFNEFHALLVRHAKDVCRSQPRCDACCLRERCALGRPLIDAP